MTTDRGARDVPKYPVCGIDIAALTPQSAAEVIVEKAIARERLEVHLCNAYTLSLVDSDDELRRALMGADLNLPDGTPVAWLGRKRGTQGPVRGPGLVGDVAKAGVPKDVKHFLYGGKKGVAEEMAVGLSQHAPGLDIAGAESPPFTPLSDTEADDLAARVKASGANLVWIGLGTPRQDYLVPRLAARVDMPVVPVGAAFDFWSGAVGEAPAWMHGTGLEWLYRLASEPRRLWRRYLLGNPLFIWSAIRHRAKRS